ncbi:unnamed protein product [Cuscuta campestris]|uniref:pectinesterase n=1 Tax=Cuscuta campestris TaxID=132261 RepID=A0A484KPH5_9ASTE|nr:unnamed protein product [Cuscuta campestris]
MRASLLLLLIVVAPTVGVVGRAAENYHDDGERLSTSSKLLSGLTEAAVNNPAMNLLDPLGIAKTNREIVRSALRFSRPKDYIEGAIRISLQQFKGVINGVVDLAEKTDDSLNRMAVEDCRELMNYAIDELQDSMTSVDDCPLMSLGQRLSDLMNWLSAVLSYSNTCIDGFTKPGLQSAISGILKTCIAQTGQALSVVSLIPQILTGLNNNHNPSLPGGQTVYPAPSANDASNGAGTTTTASSEGGGASGATTSQNGGATTTAASSKNGGASSDAANAAASSEGGGASGGASSENGGATTTTASSKNGGASSEAANGAAPSENVDSSSFSSSSEEASAANNANSFSSSSSSTGVDPTSVGSGRTLKGVHFPAWMKKSDRKLLVSRQRGGGERARVGSANVQPNAVVAQDGSGQYKTITEAINAYNPPANAAGNGTRHVIYVKAGVYDEYVLITRKQTNIFMYGDGPTKTIVTGKKCNRDGVSTFRTAPFAVVGNGFICKSMGFRNTAGPEGHQAVALRVQSDMSAFYNCRMDGYQDTLYTQTHRQFYSNCVITGTVDFIFGDAAAVIQNSVIVVRRPMDNQQNSVTAHGRTHNAEPTGLVIQNCQIIAEDALEANKTEIPSYLGRPWKPYSRTVILHSTMGDFIRPEGWMPWAGDFGLDTCDYREFGNRGPGADTTRRVTWKGYHALTNANDAMRFTVERFIQGNHWLPATGAPYFLGLKSIQ